MDPELVALQPMQLGRHQLVGMTSNSRIAGADTHFIQRLAWRPGPQSRGAIAKVTGPGTDQPDQCAQRHNADRKQREQQAVRRRRFQIRGAGNAQGVRGQQLQKRILRPAVAIGKCQQALPELREGALGPSGPPTLAQTPQRNREPEDRSERERQQQQRPGAPQACRGERESIDDYGEDNGGD